MNLRNARDYMQRFLWIRGKDGREVRLRLKPAQAKLMDVVEELERQGKPIRVIVLKARQEGISTAISGWIFARCATNQNRTAMLVTHRADATANLHQMHLRFYDGLPAVLRPMRAASNAIELVFANPAKDAEARAREPGLRSKIRCATAGGKGVGRSDTIQFVHASEYAFWPDGINTKADTLLGLLQAVPSLPGTAVFIESTARGFDDFHRRWEDAVAGRSDFVPVFFSWAEEPGYRMPVTPGTRWSPEEEALMRDHGLSPEQMAWRRWCIANNCGGDLDKFRQEYPLTPEEAFVVSGACWFRTDVLIARLRELETAKAPAARRGIFRYTKAWSEDLRGTVLTEIRFEERADGPVTIWEAPDKRTPYVLGGDTAGEGSDWFSAYVLDNTSAGMAARIWMRDDEAEFTAQVFCLATHYNQALIGLEVNFSTYPTRCLQEWGYPRLYVRQAEDDYTHKLREAFGWRTDRITRPAMLSELRQIVEAHPEIIRDADLLREMLVFVKDEGGRPAALEGEHDDLVMGYGITHRIRGQQAAVRKAEEPRRGRYTEDMLEDYNKASEAERRMMEQAWGRP